MILCCGESLIDMLPVTSAEGLSAYTPIPGGAVFNTAIALGRLGAPVRFFSGLSDDLFGAQLEEALTASNVDASACVRSDRPTTLAFVALDNGQARYTFYDRETADRVILSEDLPRSTPDIAFFGGISLVNEPCGTSLELLFHRLAEHGVCTMIDPNIRPSLLRHETAFRKRLDRMIEAATIIKLSDEDLAWLVGEGTTTERCEALLARGPAMILLTEGAKGARLHTARHEVFVAAQPTTVVDTVGAGDTFNAGILAHLHEKGLTTREAIEQTSAQHLQAALELATKAAAVTVSRRGANPPWRKELP